jgi:hypothetical protein
MAGMGMQRGADALLERREMSRLYRIFFFARAEGGRDVWGGMDACIISRMRRARSIAAICRRCAKGMEGKTVSA